MWLLDFWRPSTSVIEKAPFQIGVLFILWGAPIGA